MRIHRLQNAKDQLYFVVYWTAQYLLRSDDFSHQAFGMLSDVKRTRLELFHLQRHHSFPMRPIKSLTIIQMGELRHPTLIPNHPSSLQTSPSQSIPWLLVLNRWLYHPTSCSAIWLNHHPVQVYKLSTSPLQASDQLGDECGHPRLDYE